LIQSRQRVIVVLAAGAALVLTSGCATRRYARNQVAPVNTRVSKLEAKTNDQIAYLTNKIDRDISQLNERIATNDQKVSQVQTAVQEVQGTASRAMEEADTNKAKTEATSEAVSTLASGVANTMNYQLVEQADLTFGVRGETLSPEAKMALDQIAAKMQSLPRAVVELAGFAGNEGSASYAQALSLHRAEAVQRYLVLKNVPLRSIHIIGLGKEAPPADLEADLQAIDPNASPADRRRLARRVHIRVFGAGDITAAR